MTGNNWKTVKAVHEMSIADLHFNFIGSVSRKLELFLEIDGSQIKEVMTFSKTGTKNFNLS